MTIFIYDDKIEMVFEKHIPGDRFRYRNSLEVPSLFGVPIEVYPYGRITEVVIWTHDECLRDLILEYVKNHTKKDSKKFLEVCP